MDTMMTPQPNGPAFFFYSPDPNPESRQHGRFIPQQHPGLPPQMTMLPVVAPLPSTPVYSRPGSSCSQPPLLPKGYPMLPSTLTPVASPMPIAHKPTIVLDTELCEAEGFYSPATPPLSSSGSVISSPGSCDMLQTPLNPMFSGLDGKEACNMDGELESFPNLDWSACASPPLTPVYLPSQAQAPAVAPINTQPCDLLSPASSCPSLSPSPSPYARSISSEDFCDPRNLTVGTVNSTLAPEFSALPTLCAGEDEDQKFVLRGATPAFSPDASFEFHSQLCNNLPSFDALCDLDSEDDFVNGLVNLGDCSVVQISRSRASSDALSLSASSYLCGDDLEDLEASDSFGADSLLSPADSCDDGDSHRNKRQKNSDSTSTPIMSTVADSQSGSTKSQSPPSNQASSGSSNATETKNGSEVNSGSENAGSSLPAPTSRRGRKQSLTEDPSKTFICDICNRRFRRQEHLKRHYRSLHTHEKPFECSDCGKKFSRSDNLAQHARTHGAGAIVMNLIDDPDAMAAAAAMPGGYPHPGMHGAPGLAGGEDYQTLGRVLFQIAAEVPGSSSELSSDEGSDHGKKKRKRSE